MRRTPPRTDGSLAIKLDFGSMPARRLSGPVRSLRLAQPHDKYRALEHRRRRAQIAARRLLDVLEEE